MWNSVSVSLPFTIGHLSCFHVWQESFLALGSPLPPLKLEKALEISRQLGVFSLLDMCCLDNMFDIDCDFLTAKGTDCLLFFLLSLPDTESSTKQLLGNMTWMDLSAPKQGTLGWTLRKLPNPRETDFFKSLYRSLETQGRNQGGLFCRAELSGCHEELGRWHWTGTEGSGRACREAVARGTVRISPNALGWLEFCVGGGSAQAPLRVFSFFQSV